MSLFYEHLQKDKNLFHSLQVTITITILLIITMMRMMRMVRWDGRRQVAERQKPRQVTNSLPDPKFVIPFISSTTTSSSSSTLSSYSPSSSSLSSYSPSSSSTLSTYFSSSTSSSTWSFSFSWSSSTWSVTHTFTFSLLRVCWLILRLTLSKFFDWAQTFPPQSMPGLRIFWALRVYFFAICVCCTHCAALTVMIQLLCFQVVLRHPFVIFSHLVPCTTPPFITHCWSYITQFGLIMPILRLRDWSDTCKKSMQFHDILTFLFCSDIWWLAEARTYIHFVLESPLAWKYSRSPPTRPWSLLS